MIFNTAYFERRILYWHNSLQHDMSEDVALHMTELLHSVDLPRLLPSLILMCVHLNLKKLNLK